MVRIVVFSHNPIGDLTQSCMMTIGVDSSVGDNDELPVSQILMRTVVGYLKWAAIFKKYVHK